MNTHNFIVQGMMSYLPSTLTRAEAQVTAERIWEHVLKRFHPEPPDDTGEWHRFGTHIACRGVKIEFSGQDDDGLPTWERVVEPDSAGIIEQWAEVASPPCPTCGTPVRLNSECPVCHPIVTRPRGFGGLPVEQP